MGSPKPNTTSSDSYSSCSEEEYFSHSDHSDGNHDKNGSNDDHGDSSNNNHGSSNNEHTHEKYHGGSRYRHGRSHDHGGSNNDHGGSKNDHGGSNNDHGGSKNDHGGSNDGRGRSGGGRTERSPSHRHRGGRNSYKIYSRTQGSKPKTHTTSEVLMPSGRKCEISQLVVTKYECGPKTKLKQLSPRKREYKVVEIEMQESILNHYDCKNGGGCFKRYNIVKVEKILQGCAWRKYQNRKTDVSLDNNGKTNEKMLFHGSPEIGSIIEKGFDERHANANGKLGAGIYFTPKSSAANQFVFGFYGGHGCKKHRNKNCYICERQLLLCRVILGKYKEFKDTSVGQIVHPEPGYHSAVGIPGEGAFEYKEYVIYRGEQAYPEYLITYKIVDDGEHKH